MAYKENHTMPNGPNFNFTRVENGYSPEEVALALRAMEAQTNILSEQNTLLRNQIAWLNNTLAESNNWHFIKLDTVLQDLRNLIAELFQVRMNAAAGNGSMQPGGDAAQQWSQQPPIPVPPQQPSPYSPEDQSIYEEFIRNRGLNHEQPPHMDRIIGQFGEFDR